MAVPILHFLQQCMKVSFSAHPLEHLILLSWWQSLWQVWDDNSLWFWFAFPWQLLMLSIFLCVFWLSVFLRKMCIQVFCPFFNMTGFLKYWVVWVLYIFWILTSYQIFHLHISSPIQEVAYSFCWWFTSLSKSFLKCNPFVYFCFYFLCLMRHFQRNIAKTSAKGHTMLPVFFSKNFMVSGVTFKSLIHFEFIFV